MRFRFAAACGVAAAIVWGACAPTPPAPAGAGVRPAALVAGDGAPHQSVVVNADAADATTATLSVWHTGTGAAPVLLFGPVPARIGADGVGVLTEGQARTPEGVFALGSAFGLAPNPATRLPYFTVDDEDWWDGGPDSPTYNLHVRGDHAPAGSEHLADFPGQYDYAIDMGVNAARALVAFVGDE